MRCAISVPAGVVHYLMMEQMIEQIEPIQPTSDRALLEQAIAGSRPAMAQIARRHVAFVYHAALRQVRDPHLAEDVAQAVFVILATKIRRLKPHTILHAWLFTTTRYAAKNALKMKHRRMHHETAAAAMRHERVEPAEVADDDMQHFLDDALAELRQSDRAAVLLSYFAGRTWQQVGEATGLSADTARKRAGRAIEQMRSFFARRGIVTSSVAITGLMAESMQAAVPARLGQAVCEIAIGAGISSTGAMSAGIASGAIHSMILAKMKVAAVIVAVVSVALGGAGAMVMHHANHTEQAADRAAGDDGALQVQVTPEVTVELVGLNRRDRPEEWWNPDGSALGERFDPSESIDNPPFTHQLVLRITGDGAAQAAWGRLRGSGSGWSGQRAKRSGAPIPDAWIMCFTPENEEAKSFDFHLELATGPFDVLMSKQGSEGVHVSSDHGGVIINEVLEEHGRSVVPITIGEEIQQMDRRLVIIDHNGNEHEPSSRTVGSTGSLNLGMMKFDVSLNDILEVQLQARPYNRYVRFDNVSLKSGTKTTPRTESGPTTRPAGAQGQRR